MQKIFIYIIIFLIIGFSIPINIVSAQYDNIYKINHIINSLDNHLFSTYYYLQVETASNLGKSVMPILIKSLADERYNIRCFAADVLGNIRMRDKIAIPYLVEASTDKHPMVRQSVGIALTKYLDLNNQEVIASLKKLLQDNVWEVRKGVINSLGVKKIKIFMPEIIKMLSDEHEWVRVSAIDALEKAKDIQVMQFLRKLFDDPQEFVKVRAYHVAAKMDKSIIEECLIELKNDDTNIRKFAIKKLGWIADKNTINNLVELISEVDIEEQGLIALSLSEICWENPGLIGEIKHLCNSSNNKIKKVAEMILYYIEQSVYD